MRTLIIALEMNKFENKSISKLSLPQSEYVQHVTVLAISSEEDTLYQD
jgi:hypothetical protein